MIAAVVWFGALLVFRMAVIRGTGLSNSWFGYHPSDDKVQEMARSCWPGFSRTRTDTRKPARDPAAMTFPDLPLPHIRYRLIGRMLGRDLNDEEEAGPITVADCPDCGDDDHVCAAPAGRSRSMIDQTRPDRTWCGSVVATDHDVEPVRWRLTVRREGAPVDDVYWVEASPNEFEALLLELGSNGILRGYSTLPKQDWLSAKQASRLIERGTVVWQALRDRLPPREMRALLDPWDAEHGDRS